MCGAALAAADPVHAGRFERPGISTGVWGIFGERPGEALLQEAKAPEARLPFVRDLYGAWLRRVAE